jgi:hypothetical protein
MAAGDRDDPLADRAFAKAQALERAKQAESRAALALIEQFVSDATAIGLQAEVLRARAYSGETRYRTNVEGWYLRRDRSVGIGADAKFYVLSTPASLAARVTGVTLKPSDPPLELGRGARDGESMPLADALANRLAAGDAFP